MTPKESSYPSDWLNIAQSDLDRAKRMLDDDDPDAAGFFVQQTVEKHLKAYLLYHGWQLMRIHDLEALLNEALTYDSSLEDFRHLCQKASGYYFINRYPMPMSVGITVAEVRESLDQAITMIDTLRSGMGC
ncbi:MAG: HEPN domain-containing protein [Armatimonadota bacterium]